MREEGGQRAGRDALDPAGRAERGWPRAFELFANLVRQAADGGIVEIGGQPDSLVAAEGENVGLLAVEFFVTQDGRVLVNEINALPGFTPLSMYPQLWQATGVDYTTLVEDLIRLALARPLGLR